MDTKTTLNRWEMGVEMALRATKIHQVANESHTRALFFPPTLHLALSLTGNAAGGATS